MSTVYRASDVRLDRPVAVKVMDPRLAADPAFRVRFQREARAAARIDHAAVVGVHDQGTGTIDGEPVVFLVMELVEGGTLRDVLAARGALGVPAAFAVLEPVLAGLAEAHRRGLVHRDVKPENVLISRSGEVKVADFGLVTAAAQAGASHAGFILGTAAYLSPEQVATGSADARSDVYAAGILGYELLTGAPPYTGDSTISVAYRHVHDDVPAPSEIAGDVPPELDDLVLRATRRDPAARPADAGAFLAALCRVADRLAVPRVPAPVPPAAERETAQHRADPLRVAAGVGPRGTRALPRPVIDVPAAPAPAPTGGTGRADHVPARRRRAFTVWTAVVAALGMLVATAGWWLGSGRWTAMPPLVGLERAAAVRLLADADLVATFVEAHHDSVAPGLVAAVDPAPPARLLRGAAVRVTVSTGRPAVPPVAPGTTVAAAEAALRGAGLTPVRSTAAEEYSASVPAGAVVRTDPPAGTTLAAGGAVTLVLSEGPPRQVRVPSVVGRDADDAVKALGRAGLDVRVRSGFPFDDRRGGDGGGDDDEDYDGDARVILQNPPAGVLVEPGTTVELRTF
jgi:serine/threonine-protein kinase